MFLSTCEVRCAAAVVVVVTVKREEINHSGVTPPWPTCCDSCERALNPRHLCIMHDVGVGLGGATTHKKQERDRSRDKVNAVVM